MVLKAEIKLIVLTVLMLIGIFVIAGLLKRVDNATIAPSFEDLFQQSPGAFQTVFHMKDVIVEYYEKSESNCFIRGSNGTPSLNSKCTCSLGWHGPSCDIPTEVFRSVLSLNRTIVRRQMNPRRIIFLLPINETTERTLKAMSYLNDVVDVFVYGSISMVNSTQNQFFKDQCALQFGQKVLFVWDLDSSDSSNSGLSKPFRDLVLRAFFRISEVRMDDLVVFSRRRQTPSQKSLLFLKLHDNYPAEIVLNFPKGPQSSSYVPLDVCTVTSLINCCHFDISKLSTSGHTDQTSNARWVML